MSTAARYCAAATGLRKRQRMLPLRTSQRDFASCAKTCPLLKSLRVLRLHILANSDSEEDQQAVIEELEAMLAQKRELLTREGK